MHCVKIISFPTNYPSAPSPALHPPSYVFPLRDLKMYRYIVKVHLKVCREKSHFVRRFRRRQMRLTHFEKRQQEILQFLSHDQTKCLPPVEVLSEFQPAASRH